MTDSSYETTSAAAAAAAADDVDVDVDAAAAADDDDFRDVFGGPPRRAAMIRHLRRGSSDEVEETAPADSCPWQSKSSNLRPASDRPVFGGDEGVMKKKKDPTRYPSNDFFDDIFRGDDSAPTSNQPVVNRDPFSSAPGSRTLSPSRPLQPRDDPFGFFSSDLPNKLAKEVESRSTITSFNHGLYKGRDSASNVVGCSYSLSNLSRFSSQSIQSQDKERNEDGVFYCESPLSRSSRVKSDETVVGLKKGPGFSEARTSSSEFHFSIFRWVSKGVPSLRPLRGVRNLRSEKKVQSKKTSSSIVSIKNCSINELFAENMHGKDITIETHVECGNQESDSLLSEKPTSTGDEEDQCEIIEEAFLSMLETETRKILPSFVEAVPVNGMCHNTREEPEPHSLPEISICGKKDRRPESKPLASPFDDGDEWKISDTNGAESKVRRTVEETSINMETEENIKISNKEEVDKPSMWGLPTNSIGTLKNRFEGKVRNFVKMFDQEASSEPEINHEPQRQSFRWKSKDKFGVQRQADFSTRGMEGKMQNHSANQKKDMPDAFIAVEGDFKSTAKQNYGVKNTIHKSSDTSYGGKYSPTSVPDGSEAAFGMEDSFEENFMMLSEDQNLLQTSKVTDEIQASDTRIQQWSNGKEGNIRSLLSTLQFVLWPESGWNAVALVDIIEGNAVKRAYQKALLCLHPDKLQQKGAASHQKYIAERVFDVLQDAWTQFSSLSSL